MHSELWTPKLSHLNQPGDGNANLCSHLFKNSVTASSTGLSPCANLKRLRGLPIHSRLGDLCLLELKNRHSHYLLFSRLHHRIPFNACPLLLFIAGDPPQLELDGPCPLPKPVAHNSMLTRVLCTTSPQPVALFSNEGGVVGYNTSRNYHVYICRSQAWELSYSSTA